MGLEPENGPERRGQPIVRARPLVKGGAGHERLTPLVLRAQQGEPDAINQVVSELAPGVLRALTALLGRRLRAAGRTDRASWHESRPPATELEAIRRACFWAKAAGGRLYVVHVTIAEGLEEIARAKREGTRVTAETCPHYLFFDETHFVRLGPSAKSAPPPVLSHVLICVWPRATTSIFPSVLRSANLQS